jgi:trehalose 6-phosphate synthase/phosphatase
MYYYTILMILDLRVLCLFFSTLVLLGNICFMVFQDEDIYVFFDPEYPSESKVKPEGGSASLDRRPNGRPASNGRSNSRNPQSRPQKAQQAASERSSSSSHSSTSSNHDWREGSSVLDLKAENYFSCAVGRKRSNARYLLSSSEEVVSFLKELATETAGFQSSCADYMFLDRQ